MRTSPLSLGLAALALAGPLACEPATPPVAPTSDSIPSTPATAAVAAAPAYDLSPVAEPADVVGLLRWRNPGATLSTLGGCAGLPSEITVQGERSLLNEVFRKGLRGQVDARKLADAVALDAPMDLVVSLDPAGKRGQPIFALSLGLTSLDSAKAAATSAASPVEIVPGMWRVGEKERRDLNCVVAVSTGPTPARLVCGQREKDVIALAPYLTRTLPTAAPAATDLHAELRYAPIDGRFGELLRQYAQGLPVIVQSQVSIGDPAFDRALTDAATALGDEAMALTRDLDGVTIDLSSDASVCLTTSIALKLRDKSSWIAGSMLDRPDRAGPPPAIFWRAPKDSASAFFSRNGDPARLTGIIKTLRTMVDSGLGKFQVGSADDRRALADLIATPLGKDTNSVQASGHIDAPRQRADKAKADGKRTAQQTLDEVLNGFGWSVLGFDEGSDALAKWLKDLVAVYGRRGLMDPLRKELGSDARYLPTIRLVAAPATLGKGALGVEIKFDIAPEKPTPPPKGTQRSPAPAPAATKPERITFSLHILLMPDGKNTWIAFGANKDELVKHLLMSRSTAPESDSLASRPALEPLRGSKNMSGGFFSLSSFTRAAELGMNGPGAMAGLGELSSILSRMPHKGETPIFFATTVTAGSAPRGEVTLKVAKGSVEDLGVLLMGLLQQRDSGGQQMAPPPRRP
jgi:hypothetical protein